MKSKMIKLIFLFILLNMPKISLAQNGMGGMPPQGMPRGGMPEEMNTNFKKPRSTDDMLKVMTEKLQLDELQQLQVRELLLEVEKERPRSSSKPTEKPNFEELKEKMESEKNKMKVKLKKILNKEQFEKWDIESENWKPE